ncbi:MAG: putative TPR repeat methyltransferase [Candidatus Poriferisodalaceae bacterium]|jgi:predicted TPR repeat methyltransferase
MIERPPRRDSVPDEATGIGGSDHPIRRVTREVAFDGRWDSARAAKVGALFDDLATEWHHHVTVERLDPLRDALKRGVLATDFTSVALEVGSGTGIATPTIASAFKQVVTLDLSSEMLVRAPREWSGTASEAGQGSWAVLRRDL